MSETPLFEIKDISKRFVLPHGKTLHVLEKISFALHPERGCRSHRPIGMREIDPFKDYRGADPG